MFNKKLDCFNQESLQAGKYCFGGKIKPVILKIGRFDNIDSIVIISSASKAI